MREAICTHLTERGEPASYLHVHAAGLVALVKAHALKQKDQEFDDALRSTQALLQKALEEDPRFVHYSSGESVDTGLWGLSALPAPPTDGGAARESLSDRVEIAIVTFLQKHPNSIYREIEQDLYPRFPGLLTPSMGMLYAVLSSYAQRENGGWQLRPEDVATARREELTRITALIEAIGKRLGYTTRKQEKNYLWEQNGTLERTFYILASALLGRALAETPYPLEQTMIVIPGDARPGGIQGTARPFAGGASQKGSDCKISLAADADRIAGTYPPNLRRAGRRRPAGKTKIPTDDVLE